MKARRFVLRQDVVIPTGTVLSRAANERGGEMAVEAVVGMGKDSAGWFVMAIGAIEDAPSGLIEEVE
jgi:hypothetical protein